MAYYNKNIRQTLKELEASESGLTEKEQQKRLEEYGPNLIDVRGEPLWRKIIEPFANVFMLVLFAAAIISLFHHAALDAIIIFAIIIISATIYYIQRFSTERILRALRQHDAQMVQVLRGGKSSEVESSQLVPGDVMLLSEGEKIPADARVLTVSSLRVDEAQLTGESEPITKHTDAVKGVKEVYERTNMLFQGSFVVSGETTAIVTATGNETEFGQLASLTENTTLKSPVQEKIDKLISQIIAVVGAMAVAAFTLSMLRGMEFAEGIRFVLALAVSAVPESLPIAVSVVLVLGMRRMAAKKALVRKMRAIETVGVLTTIASDKTGTLTRNKLTVHDVWQPESVKANAAELILKAANGSGTVHDPLDVAMLEYAKEQKVKPSKQKPLRALPFDQEVAMSGNVWHHGTTYHLTLKGAPEHILQRSSLTENEREAAELALHELTSNGYRVIAVAELTRKKDIEKLTELTKSDQLEFVGFLAVADILRPEAKQAIKAAASAGVTVRMITGDHFETAYHIGKKLGMVTSRDQVFDSRQMHVMSDEELEDVVDNIRVFSRVIPEHKYRLLSILKQKHITAMTGDGVNDVPALTNAHVGFSMGSGAQIAKDAGDIILMDDNFKSIVDAMREGRIIYANIRRMLLYLLSTNAGEVITMIASLIIGLPLPLVPVQILWINLVTDSALVIPLGLEPGEKSIMQQKPKKPNAPILNKFFISRMILIALSMAITTLTLFVIYMDAHDTGYGRTIAFSALVVMQWANAFNVRSDHESVFTRIKTFSLAFYIGLAAAIGLQWLAIFGPLADVLHVQEVALDDLLITGGIAFVIPIIVVELHKLYGRKVLKKS